MPPHVLSQAHQLPRGIEQAGGVKAAGAVEHPLGRPQTVGQRRQQPGADGEAVVSDVEVGAGPHGVDARLATESAGGSGDEVAGTPDRRQGRARHQVDAEHVVLLGLVLRDAVADGADLARLHEALGDEEAGGQLEVVAGGAHGDGQGVAVDADLEGLLGGQGVELNLAGILLDPEQAALGGDGGHDLTVPTMTDFARRYTEALETESGSTLGLTDEEVAAVLDLARDVAHATERLNAPLVSYAAGKFVLDLTRAGVPMGKALEQARAAVERALSGEEPAES